MTTPEAPRRLRAADVIDSLEGLLEQALTRSPSEPSVSVTFTRNAKGETQIETKVHASGDVGEGALELLAQKVYAQSFDLYTRASTAFPGPRTNGETQ